MGDYSQVMHEEALVARILCPSKQTSRCSTTQLTYLKAQARAIYGPKYPHGSTFDVIYSGDILAGNDLVAWLIVYPMPDNAAFKTGKVVSNEWTPVLKSRRISKKGTGSTLQREYQELLGKLRIMMVETMVSMEKVEETEKLKKDDISTDK
ncbi:uncharacterized protein J4E87_008704 [Alternaria ethzedia]|uniref:uncharacterized protein n=1 Tax=Alternaria ethzedia TaxID=181014 RepID=UPI0020C2FAD9|nr:uncharacterized protein J4E87_008704 [Alternaria ethzedia]KAI4616438.1 hypothetical protein J4E87_008704 [Alternaria ethzedia]